MSNYKITTLPQLKEAISKGGITDVNEIANIVGGQSIYHIPFKEYESVPGHHSIEKAQHLLNEYRPKESPTPLSVDEISKSIRNACEHWKNNTEGDADIEFESDIRKIIDQQTAALQSQVEDMEIEVGNANLYRLSTEKENESLKQRCEKMEGVIQNSILKFEDLFPESLGEVIQELKQSLTNKA